jgi:hypothetical protein
MAGRFVEGRQFLFGFDVIPLCGEGMSALPNKRQGRTMVPSLLSWPGLTRPSIFLRKCLCESRWMPGSSPGMTSAFVSTSRFQIHVCIPAAREAPGLCGIRVPRKRGRRECRALNRTRSLVCENKKAYERSHHRFAETTRHSLHDGVTAYFVLSLVTGLFCHHRLADTSAKLDASVGASGPHDFAVRAGITRQLMPPTSIASRAQRP